MRNSFQRAGQVAIMAAFAMVALQAAGPAAAQARDAQRLGKDLTPTGTEVAASADGRIPAHAPATRWVVTHRPPLLGRAARPL